MVRMYAVYGLVASQLGDVQNEFLQQNDGTIVSVNPALFRCLQIFCQTCLKAATVLVDAVTAKRVTGEPSLN